MRYNSVRASFHAICAALLAVAVVGWAGLARAEKKSIAVHVEGPGAADYREMIVELVPQGVEVIEESSFKKALRSSGLGSVGFTIVNPRAKKQLLKVLKKAVKKAEIDAVIVARVSRGRGGSELLVLMLEADSDEASIDDKVSLAGKKSKHKGAIEELLGSPLSKLAPPPPEPDPEPKEAKDDEKDEEDEEKTKSEFKKNRPGSELFNAGLGVSFGGRFFSYPDSPANTPNTRPYDVFGVPAFSVGAEIYPAATLAIPVASDIGIYVRYAHFLGLTSQTPDARAFDSSWNRFNIGARFRYRVGDADKQPVVLGLGIGYGFHNFTFEGQDQRANEILAEIGDAEYSELRIGLDARIPFSAMIALSPRFAYLAQLSGGDDVYDRFREASVSAVELGAAFIFVIGNGIEAHAGLDYARYFSSFTPIPGDSHVAGGALDQFVFIDLGASYVY